MIILFGVIHAGAYAERKTELLLQKGIGTCVCLRKLMSRLQA